MLSYLLLRLFLKHNFTFLTFKCQISGHSTSPCPVWSSTDKESYLVLRKYCLISCFCSPSPDTSHLITCEYFRFSLSDSLEQPHWDVRWPNLGNISIKKKILHFILDLQNFQISSGNFFLEYSPVYFTQASSRWVVKRVSSWECVVRDETLTQPDDACQLCDDWLLHQHQQQSVSGGMCIRVREVCSMLHCRSWSRGGLSEGEANEKRDIWRKKSRFSWI